MSLKTANRAASISSAIRVWAHESCDAHRMRPVGDVPPKALEPNRMVRALNVMDWLGGLVMEKVN